MRTNIQRAFAPIKAAAPRLVSTGMRALGTALIAPLLFSSWSGHFKSSLRGKAVSSKGDPIPWYTYPCIHFLELREFSDRTIVEFGGGQSTLWWAIRARKVITIEQDKDWHAHLKKLVPVNVELHHVGAAEDGRSPNMSEVIAIFDGIDGCVDIVVNDGTGERSNLLELSFAKLSADGALICDDSSGYGFQEAMKDWPVGRVDFFGHQPAVVLPNCTSIYFKSGCFLIDPKWPIVDVAKLGYESNPPGKRPG